MDIIEQAYRIIKKANFELTPIAKQYIDALPVVYSRYGEKGVRTQLLYIINNLIAKTPEQKLALQQLKALAEGKPIPKKYVPPSPNVMTETELTQISDAFERWSEKLFTKKDVLSLSDFEKFAKLYGYPLDKVLVANPWSDDALDEEVQYAIRRLYQTGKIKILWGE
ncbi:MAG: hypothetical protein DRO93_08695 [Candidatus Thorarchaeota archaeon]|nr:MAG: hypothetical protein DRO93_08695 [Candidatus Thorarchaeota archaeon]